MIHLNSRFWRTIVSLIIIVPVGFYSKFYNGPAADWVNNSLGGVFYEIFWCLVLFLFFPAWNPLKIVIIVFFSTCFLEVLQLWHPPVLEAIRANFIGATILGSCFVWTDFPYYIAGSAVGWIWVRYLKFS